MESDNMIYLLVLLEQIALYHLVGSAGWRALESVLGLPRHRSFFASQFLGICVFSGVQFCSFLLPLPKTHVAILLLAILTTTLLYGVARARPRYTDFLPSHHWPKSWADYAFLLLLIPLALFWGGLAVTTGYNMVPKGDGWTWAVKATYWAFHAPLDIPGSPYRAYPPLSTLIESMNLLLLGSSQPNCSLLGMWWAHIVTLGLVFALATRLTNRWGGMILVAMLTFSPDLVFNITLGYRDALMMKLVAAMSLAGMLLTRKPDDRKMAILLGFLVAAASTLKDEGLLYSALCLLPLGCSLMVQYGKRFGALVVDTLPILIPALITIAFWWSVRLGLGMKGFQGQSPSPSDILDGLTYARLQLIVTTMWASLKTPIFGVALLTTVLLPFRTTPKTVLQPLVSTVLCLMLITFVYVATTANVAWHIQTSMSRLMFTPYALAAVFSVLTCFGILSAGKE